MSTAISAAPCSAPTMQKVRFEKLVGLTRGPLGLTVPVYLDNLDDILVMSKTMEEHPSNLREEGIGQSSGGIWDGAELRAARCGA